MATLVDRSRPTTLWELPAQKVSISLRIASNSEYRRDKEHTPIWGRANTKDILTSMNVCLQAKAVFRLAAVRREKHLPGVRESEGDLSGHGLVTSKGSSVIWLVGVLTN